MEAGAGGRREREEGKGKCTRIILEWVCEGIHFERM